MADVCELRPALEKGSWDAIKVCVLKIVGILHCACHCGSIARPQSKQTFLAREAASCSTSLTETRKYLRWAIISATVDVVMKATQSISLALHTSMSCGTHQVSASHWLENATMVCCMDERRCARKVASVLILLYNVSI